MLWWLNTACLFNWVYLPHSEANNALNFCLCPSNHHHSHLPPSPRF